MQERRPVWDTLYIRARIATLASGRYSVIEPGALAISGDRIAWVGVQEVLPDRAAMLAREVIDCDGRWMTPGLVDCHTHLVHAGHRAHEFELRLQGASYEEIARAGGGILSTVRATREASEMTLVRESAARLACLTSEGVTTVEIKSGYGLETATEARILRVARLLGEGGAVDVRTTFLGAHALPPEFAGRADDYIDYVCEEMLPAVATAGLADAVDVFCESIGFTPEQTARVFRKAAALGLPVKLHADQLSDCDGAALAARFGALSADHVEYTSEAGVARLAATGTVAVLLPGSFYFLHESQLPPIDALRRHGVPCAVATDANPGSSPLTSILLAVNMACTLFRLTPEEALAGVTLHAARALGLAATHGSLEAGKVANLAIWSIDEPAELAYRMGHNPLWRRVYRGHVRGTGS